MVPLPHIDALLDETCHRRQSVKALAGSSCLRNNVFVADVWYDFN